MQQSLYLVQIVDPEQQSFSNNPEVQNVAFLQSDSSLLPMPLQLQRFAASRGTVTAVSNPVPQMVRID